LLDSGTLGRYVDELSVTGLTSNPTIFNHAIERSTAYDWAIRDRSRSGQTVEALFVELAIARQLHALAGRSNLFIKIPGTKEGVAAIEEAIFAGVPVNVTLLLSREQYVAARCVFARNRAPHRSRPAASRKFCRLRVHQPLGCGGDGQGA
jgi:transaldolase